MLEWHYHYSNLIGTCRTLLQPRVYKPNMLQSILNCSYLIHRPGVIRLRSGPVGDLRHACGSCRSAPYIHLPVPGLSWGLLHSEHIWTEGGAGHREEHPVSSGSFCQPVEVECMHVPKWALQNKARFTNNLRKHLSTCRTHSKKASGSILYQNGATTQQRNYLDPLDCNCIGSTMYSR